MTIDLDKWAAVSTDDLHRAADLLEQSDFAFAKTRLAAQEIAARLRAAHPTDAPVLIDPARLRELEVDAVRYRWLRAALSDRSRNGKSHYFCSIPEGCPQQLDADIDKALQEQPNV